MDNPRFDSEPICQYGTRFSPMTSDVMNIDILFELLIERPGKVSRWSCLKPLSRYFFQPVIIAPAFLSKLHHLVLLFVLVFVLVFVFVIVFLFVFVLSICTKMELFEAIIWDLFVQNCAEPAAFHLR